MTDLQQQLQAAEAAVARLKAAMAGAPCAEVGHAWQSFGGMNAGCNDDPANCGCSVPVHECTRCGDCDYGDNAEANDTRRRCAESRHE